MTSTLLARDGVVLTDGGLATRLRHLGADLDHALWSARLLHDDPDLILTAHRDYFAAGADVAITASYQASIPGFRACGLSAARAGRLLRDAVDLAARARDEAGGGLVAASVGPYGAALADGSEYTGDYGLTEARLRGFHHDRWHILADTPADVLACETIPSLPEVRALAALMADTPATPVWVAFACRDAAHLNDGTPLARAARELRAARPPNLAAVGVNCTAPRHVPGLLGVLAELLPGVPLLAYPNTGRHDPAPGAGRTAAGPEEFAAASEAWRAAGARVLGGCCGTTPAHIRALRERHPRE